MVLAISSVSVHDIVHTDAPNTLNRKLSFSHVDSERSAVVLQRKKHKNRMSQEGNIRFRILIDIEATVDLPS